VRMEGRQVSWECCYGVLTCKAVGSAGRAGREATCITPNQTTACDTLPSAVGSLLALWATPVRLFCVQWTRRCRYGQVCMHFGRPQHSWLAQPSPSHNSRAPHLPPSALDTSLLDPSHRQGLHPQVDSQCRGPDGHCSVYSVNTACTPQHEHSTHSTA
jgi:hypothetical protein